LLIHKDTSTGANILGRFTVRLLAEDLHTESLTPVPTDTHELQSHTVGTRGPRPSTEAHINTTFRQRAASGLARTIVRMAGHHITGPMAKSFRFFRSNTACSADHNSRRS
jgi:hypothetical protein